MEDKLILSLCTDMWEFGLRCFKWMGKDELFNNNAEPFCQTFRGKKN